MDRIFVLGIGFDNVNMAEAVDKCLNFIKGDSANLVVTPNPEIVMKAKDDAEFKEIINNAALVIPDGIGVVKGAKILGTPLKERVAGYDLICNLFEEYKIEGAKLVVTAFGSIKAMALPLVLAGLGIIASI